MFIYQCTDGSVLDLDEICGVTSVGWSGEGTHYSVAFRSGATLKVNDDQLSKVYLDRAVVLQSTRTDAGGRQ